MTGDKTLKTKFFRLTLYSIIVYLTCLNSAAVSAAPSEENDVHFCGFDHWQRDNRRYARTFAANLNIGEPRTVRLIYFLPNDRPYRGEVVQQLKNDIPWMQTFYGEQMKAHGYGFKTFRVETDPQNKPLVHRMDGQHPESHYLNDTVSTVIDEVGRTFNLDANIYLIVFDNSSGRIGRSGARLQGYGERRGKDSGIALVPDDISGVTRAHIAAHELGHAFGLYHDFNSIAYLMSYGALPQSRLSVCSAEFLAVHPYFTPDSPIQEGQPPTIELISPLTYPAGSESVSVQLKLSDSEGLHQVLLVNHRAEVWGCRGLPGQKDAVVQLDYDGFSGFQAYFWDNPVGLSDFESHKIAVTATDTNGNESLEVFTLSETAMHPRPQSLVKISGDNQQGPVDVPSAQPLVVEVRDQNDNALPNEKVMFTVIAGVGKLSGRFTVETAMTDANGRAEKTLTLGRGTNIVEANIDVAGVDAPSVTFSAIGVGPPAMPPTDGDYQRWHLPDGANMRLGKGHIGMSDRVIAFSPDGQLLAVASSIGVWIYDVATSRELTLLPSTYEVDSVAFSPDGKKLAWAGDKVVVWDVARQTQIASYGIGSSRTSVSFSPDGTLLAFSIQSAYAHEDEKVTLLDIASGDIATLSGGESGGVALGSNYHRQLSVSFSPDGRLLASGSERDGTVKLWDVATRTLIVSLSGHRLSVSSVAFSPDGRLLASGSYDETIKLWDVLARKNIATLKGHSFQIASLSFSPDGKLLASSGTGGSWGGTIKLWNVATKQNINTIRPNRWGVRTVLFSPDGQLLASGASDGAVKLWDVKSGTVELSISGHGNEGATVSFSPDGRTLASGSSDGTVKLWDIATGTNIETLGPHIRSVDAVSFSPNGNLLASGSADTEIKLWDVTTGTSVDSKFTYRCQGAVNSVSFSIDGITLASGDAWGLLLWNTVTGAQVSTPVGYATWTKSVSFSPDGTIIAFGADFGTRLWDVATQTPIATLGHASQVESVSFSPDGAILASGDSSHGSTITLWDVLKKENIGVLDDWSGGNIRAISFSPDGTTLASGAGRRVKLWDVSERDVLITLEGHTGRNSVGVTSVSFSPDGTVLASGSDDDGTILLWNMSGLMEKTVAEVDIPDSDLRTVIEATLGKSADDTITQADMESLNTITFEELSINIFDLNITDLTGLEAATNLEVLVIFENSISDISPLSGLTQLEWLGLSSNSISDISALSGLANLNYLNLYGNNISDISPLVSNTGLGGGDEVDVTGNPLNFTSLHTHIPTLQKRGVTIAFDSRTPHRVRIVSGNDQQGHPGTVLENSFVVEVQDESGVAFKGGPVTFAVATGGGALSVTNTTTDANGRARSTLTLGSTVGTNTVRVSVAKNTQAAGILTAEAVRIPMFDMFTLSIPAGTHAIHIPLRVRQINGEDRTIETVGDLYDALSDAVNLIISINAGGNWIGYLGDGSGDNAAIGDDTGLIAVMKNAATLELAGDALGANGTSDISIDIGNNLIGVPLDPENISMISDLLVEGVAAIGVSKASGDGFHTITAAGQDGDGPLMGGAGYLLVASAAGSIPIVGSAWENEGAAAAPAVVFDGAQTPVLHVEGGVVDGLDMLSQIPQFRVTVKNLSTGASIDTVLRTEESTASYRGTFVEFSRRAAKAGDVLEIAAHSPSPYVGVRPVPQIVVSAEAVLASRIKLPDLELYEIPSETVLLANYPNPFNPETWIPYRLAKAAEVTLDIYDTNGSLVRTIDVGFKPAAVYESLASAIYWDGRNTNGESVASGVYFYRLTAGDYAATRRMVILK